MKKSFVFALHIGFWTCYLILMAIMLFVYYRNNGGDQEMRVLNAFKNIFLFAFVPSFFSFYLFYFLLFPKYLQQEKYFLAVIYGILMTVTTALIAYFLHRYLIDHGYVLDMDEGGKNGSSTIIIVVLVMSLIGLICGTAGLVIKGFITWFNEIRLKAALKEKNHEMEMALIKSQLDPHLLFNTINNIDALILKDALQASNYLNKLSDIMRFILYETKTEQIPLAKEIEYIEKYIELQKIRTSNVNYVDFQIKGNIGNKHIAPMVFIPFIENAFKHTGNKKLVNAIMVSIHITAESIQLICENKYDSRKPVIQDIGGLGDELIRKRLELIYGNRHRLTVHKTHDQYSINLSIPND